MKREINIYQEKALKEFIELWNDVDPDEQEFDVFTEEEAINICISIAAEFMREKEARTAFYCKANPYNILTDK